MVLWTETMKAHENATLNALLLEFWLILTNRNGVIFNKCKPAECSQSLFDANLQNYKTCF